MAQQERAIQTRRMVIEAAAKVFAERGYASANMAQIIETAGVTKGAVYFHFPSKEALAMAVVAEQARWQVEDVTEDVPQLQSLIDTSRRFAQGLRDDPVARGAVRLVIEYGSFSKKDPTPYLQWIGLVRDQLARARSTGELREGVDIDAMAEFMVGTFTGQQLISEVLSERADLTERIALLWKLLLPSLAEDSVVPRLAV